MSELPAIDRSESFGYSVATPCGHSVDESITHNVQASFEGLYPQQATLNATSFDGQNYTVCTVTYFRFKPAANMTTVTVEPHATEVTVPIQSPEEMQHDTEAGGQLQIWHEFSWWYPWYRMHVRASVNPTVHLALNPMLPGGEIAEWSDDLVELFSELIEESLITIVLEVCGLYAAYLAARLLSLVGRMAQPWLFGLAFAVMCGKLVVQGYLWFKAINDRIAMLASALVNTLLAIFALGRLDLVGGFVKAIVRVLAGSAGSAMQSLFQEMLAVLNKVDRTFRFCRDWIDGMEIVSDCTLAIVSWIRFFQL